MKGVDLKNLQQLNNPAKETGIPGKPSFLVNLLSKEISLGGNKVSDKTKETFYLELGMLLSAGMDIRTVLDLLLAEIKKKNEISVFEQVRDEIIKGASLSDALHGTGCFSEYEYFSIKIGEETGKLSSVLKDLASFYKKKISQRRKVIAALTYPAIITSFALVAVVFMLNFVVPMFADVFKRFGGELPAITKFILRLSGMVKAGFWYLIVLASALVAIVLNQKNKIWFRDLSGKFILKLPVVGSLVHKVYLARFCNSMHLMISSRVSMLRAIRLMRQIIGFYPIEITLQQVEQDILAGESLHKSLASFKIYPAKMISLIKAGEEVNKLDFFFLTLFEQYTEETEHQTTLLGNLIEPFIIIFLGVIVGVILVAMYLPLFQLGQNF